jgi:hypothetical protein
MTTMAAIDRLVHHSVILDMMSVESYRAETANQQHLPSAQAKKPSPRRTTRDSTPSSRLYLDASTPTQDDLGAAENEHELATFGASDTSGNPLLDGSKSASLIVTDGTV